MRHVPFNDFSGGLDLRDQVFSDSTIRFRLLNNFYVNNGKKLVRRTPLISDGTIDVQTQGLVKLDGTLYAIAPKGTAPAQTGPAVLLMKFLYFDNPDYCTTWTLVHAKTFNGVVIAYIRHTYPGVTVTSRLMLHVFDGSTTKPTYVEDPYCPTNWGPTLPLHAYGQGFAGSFSDYQPFIGIGAQRAWAPRPDGNNQYSKLGNARQWNTRALTDVENTGELYYFIQPQGGPVFNFIVSSVFSDLALDQQWSAYVCEYLDANGTWQQLIEDSATPTQPGHYSPQSIASRFTVGANEIQLQVYPPAGTPPDSIIRFRLIAGPAPVQIVSGCQLQPSAYLTTPNGLQYVFPVAINYQEFLDDWEVLIDGTVLTTASPAAMYSVQQTADGNCQIVFSYYSFNVSGGTWASQLDYLAATGPAPAVIYNGGVLIPSSGYTIANVGGKAHFAFSVSINSALITQAICTPPANCQLQFSAPNPIVSAGVISFEGNNLPVAAQAITLASDASYQLSIVVPGSGFSQQMLLTTDNQVVPGNGYQRYFTLATYVIQADQLAPFIISTQTPYLYGSDKNQPNSWFNAKNVAYLINDVGVAEAGSINTASYADTGGTVLSISQLQARMAFHFDQVTILFAVDASQAGIAYLDTIPWGVTAGGAPQPVSYYDGCLIMTPSGPRCIFLTGQNSQSMMDTNVGLPIERLPAMIQQAAVFWPKLGLYITAGMVNGAFMIECLSYSKEGGITAWSTWSCAGLTSVDPYSFVVMDSKLYLRSGANLYHFEAKPAICQDDNDITPFEARAEMHYFAFGDSSVQKAVMGVAFSMNGTLTLSEAILPYASQRILQLCQASGVTYGQYVIPLRTRGVGIATILSCVDPTMYPDDNGNPQAFTLDQFGLDIKELRPMSRRG